MSHISVNQLTVLCALQGRGEMWESEFLRLGSINGSFGTVIHSVITRNWVEVTDKQSDGTRLLKITDGGIKRIAPNPENNEYPENWEEIATKVKAEAGCSCVRCGHPHDPASHHVLTVHHFNGLKSDCRRWNLMALCQRCHLSVQGRVDPSIALMFTPNTWSMPYVAGAIDSEWCVKPTQPWAECLADWIVDYELDERPWPIWAPRPPAP